LSDFICVQPQLKLFYRIDGAKIPEDFTTLYILYNHDLMGIVMSPTITVMWLHTDFYRHYYRNNCDLYSSFFYFFSRLMDEFLREFSGRRKVPNCWKCQKIPDDWPDRWIISYDYTILLWRIILHMCQRQKIFKSFKTTFNGIFLQNWTIF
jgi:hypothetical protein